ncbi:TetR/AcrR family transcriptional regulator [Loigolactobacillus iwatensis]|uniref:TetR/AcrR family transcriptional regulator n=1 Tax=Loigolactobacillus iwatensis TaxID=1267156 RepID=UPI000F7EF30B|nr:TetR/AcrR family transcriptional regulator [Loigolactobacillus iwatensis]
MAKQTDLRVIRTKKMIFSAFMKLVEKKGLSAVTIQEIADEAMINRATFYAHFKDKQDLYQQIFNKAITSFAKILDADIIRDGNKIKIKTIETLLTQLFQEIWANREFFLLASSGTNQNTLAKMLQDLLQKRYAQLFSQLKITQDETPIPTSFIVSYMTSIFIGTVHWWVYSDGSFSPEHLAKLIIQLIANGHLTVLGLEMVND